MADQLLPIAATPDAVAGVAALGATGSGNQGLSGDPHPFTLLLQGQAVDAQAGQDDAGVALIGNAVGKLLDQGLPTDGKDLPDAAALLHLAGLPLEAEAQQVTAADAAALDPATVLAIEPGQAEAETETETETTSEEAILPTIGSATEASQEDGVVLAAPLAAAQTAVASADEVAEALAPATRRPLPAAPVYPQQVAHTDNASEDALSLALPEPAADTARAVTAAVQQALAQRQQQASGRREGLGATVRESTVAPAAGAEGPTLGETAPVGTAAAESTQSQRTSSLPSLSLSQPLRQPGWDQALGDRVQWMVGQKLQAAEIRLNPAHLGPMEVRIDIQNEQAHISFTAQHAPVREALEAALPRLREMLGEGGLELGDVNVSDQSLAEQRQSDSEDSAPAQAFAGAEEVTEGSADAVSLVSRVDVAAGRLDLFA